MKTILSLLLFNFCILSFAQTPRFKKYSVAETPMKLYLPTDPTWERSHTGDGTDIYIYDDLFGTINYTAIIVKLSEKNSNDDPESLLENYMIFAEDSVFELDQKAGFGKGHTLIDQPAVKGIMQLGKSKEGKDYKILGWTNGKLVAILATSSLEEMNYNIQELFLKGIRFPQ